MKKFKGFRMAVLATDGFEESELTEPVRAFRDEGMEVDILSPSGEAIQGFQHFEKASKVEVNGKISDAKPEDYDALHLPGGALNADALRMDTDAQRWVNEFCKKRKPIAAICHAAWLLVSAKEVAGRRMTSWPSLKDDIENAGGAWLDSEVVVHHHFVTSRKPEDLEAYCREMLEMCSEFRERKAA